MAAEKAKQFLECSYRIEPTSRTLVAPGYSLFELTDALEPKRLEDFAANVQISENSTERSKKVSASFGIEGNYYAFSGAAEASLEHFNASKTKTIRADHDLYALRYVCQADVLDCSEIITPQVVKFVKKSKPEKIVKKLGHFYATEVTLGGHLQLTRIIKARAEDSADSLAAKIEATYTAALIGSVKANAKGSTEDKRSITGREETCTLSVQGGDVSSWLAFDGTAESKAACQKAWSDSIDDASLFPLKMQLSPIWEAFEEHDELVDKAAELKKYLISKWEAEYKRVAEMSKQNAKKIPLCGTKKIMAALDKAESKLEPIYRYAHGFLQKNIKEHKDTKRNKMADEGAGFNLKNIRKLKKSLASGEISKKGVVKDLRHYEKKCIEYHKDFTDWGGHVNSYAAQCHAKGQKIFSETLDAVLLC